LDSDVNFLWVFGGEILPWLFIFKFLCCDICWSKSPFTSYCSDKVNNSAINQIFGWVANNCSPHLFPH
jgi:hypothetical protein